MSAGNLYKIAAALSTSCDYILFGVYRVDDKSRLENLYEDFLERFDSEQKEVVVKMLGSLLEISEKTIKQEL